MPVTSNLLRGSWLDVGLLFGSLINFLTALTSSWSAHRLYLFVVHLSVKGEGGNNTNALELEVAGLEREFVLLISAQFNPDLGQKRPRGL